MPEHVHLLLSEPQQHTLASGLRGSGKGRKGNSVRRWNIPTLPGWPTLTVSGKETGSGEIKGKMVFNRKGYGMNKGIPFIKTMST
jgi:hypothetical protein